MNGLVVEGQLQFTLSTHISSQACKDIAHLFEQHLQHIIEHCVQQQQSIYTPSDFPTVQISQSLLNQLQKNDSEIEAIYPAKSLGACD